jgi:hypothetical protein
VGVGKKDMGGRGGGERAHQEGCVLVQQVCESLMAGAGREAHPDSDGGHNSVTLKSVAAHQQHLRGAAVADLLGVRHRPAQGWQLGQHLMPDLAILFHK